LPNNLINSKYSNTFLIASSNCSKKVILIKEQVWERLCKYARTERCPNRWNKTHQWTLLVIRLCHHRQESPNQAKLFACLYNLKTIIC